jgi:hypothetical protein
MNQEEAQALAAATERVTSLQEYVAELEQLLRDIEALCDRHLAYTWNEGEGLPLQERMRELGIMRTKGVKQ